MFSSDMFANHFCYLDFFPNHVRRIFFLCKPFRCMFSKPVSLHSLISKHFFVLSWFANYCCDSALLQNHFGQIVFFGSVCSFLCAFPTIFCTYLVLIQTVFGAQLLVPNVFSSRRLLEPLRVLFELPRTLLGAAWRLLGRSWAVLGCFLSFLGLPWVPLGASWGDLGLSWGEIGWS
jgi:hypothetical protein